MLTTRGWIAFGQQAGTPSPTDIPVPADYTGDGLIDFAVWNPQTGFWKYRHSSTGAYIQAHMHEKKIGMPQALKSAVSGPAAADESNPIGVADVQPLLRSSLFFARRESHKVTLSSERDKKRIAKSPERSTLVAGNSLTRQETIRKTEYTASEKHDAVFTEMDTSLLREFSGS